MNANIAALLYLASGVLFILALRGLSSPESSRTGNRLGMIGMALAIATTLAWRGVPDGLTSGLIVAGFAIGGGIGAIIARRIAMTAMPQLVAAFHSLVGLGRRAGCGRGAVFARRLWHLHLQRQYVYRPDPDAEPGRNESGRCDRRHHLCRIDHRLCKTERKYVGRADPASGAAPAQSADRADHHWADRLVRHQPGRMGLLG